MYEDKHIVERKNLKEELRKREEAVKSLLSSIPGENPEREGLMETPRRVSLMYEELYGGYEMSPHEILSKQFDASNWSDGDYDESIGCTMNGIVIVKDIQFYSQCEHHMVPFFGKVNIAYMPGGKVVGLSKMARLVECFARRLQIQERFTSQIAEALYRELNAKGVMVVVKATHLCMVMRGVKNHTAETVTNALRGEFARDSGARREAQYLMSL